MLVDTIQREIKKTGTLSSVAKRNPQLLKAIKSFYGKKFPDAMLLNDIVSLTKTAVTPLNGETGLVMNAVRKVLSSKNCFAHMAILYEHEAKLYDTVNNNSIASKLYLRMASDLSIEPGRRKSFYHKSFFCAVDSGNSLEAVKIAKMLMAASLNSIDASLFLKAGKISEVNGDLSSAITFYSNALSGDYNSVMDAKESVKRLNVDSPPVYDYDSRFANRETD